MKKAGLPKIRFHDLRHHAITRLAEQGISDPVILSVAGHVSKRMLEYYSHIRLEAKRAAIAKIDTFQVPAEPATADHEQVN